MSVDCLLDVFPFWCYLVCLLFGSVSDVFVFVAGKQSEYKTATPSKPAPKSGKDEKEKDKAKEKDSALLTGSFWPLADDQEGWVQRDVWHVDSRSTASISSLCLMLHRKYLAGVFALACVCYSCVCEAAILGLQDVLSKITPTYLSSDVLRIVVVCFVSLCVV